MAVRPIVLALLCLVALTRPAAAADVLLRTLDLENGIRVVLAPAVPSDAIAVHVTVRAGSNRDPQPRAGAALLASRVIGSRLPRFTADLNQERSLFTASATLATLPEILGQLRDALAHRPIDGVAPPAPAAVAAEDALLRLVYGTRPHGHSANIVSPEVSAEDVQRFIEAHYVPSSTVIALAGTFADAEVTRIAVESLGGLRSSRRVHACASYATRLRRQRSAALTLPVKQTEIHWGYPTAASTTRDWYALNILADVIGQGPGSRLQRRLVEGGLVRDFGEGETEWPCASSIFRMRARLLAHVSPDAVMAAVDEELARLRRELVSDGELQVAREQERAWANEQLSTAAGVASAAARAVLFYGDARRVNTEAARMSLVTAEDVLRVARRYLAPANRAVVIVRP